MNFSCCIQTWCTRRPIFMKDVLHKCTSHTCRIKIKLNRKYLQICQNGTACDLRYAADGVYSKTFSTLEFECFDIFGFFFSKTVTLSCWYCCSRIYIFPTFIHNLFNGKHTHISHRE